MQATLDGVPFRTNPDSIKWDFSVKTAETTTIGGVVIQVYGVDLGDMRVTGSFGVGGWSEQEAMLRRMKGLGDRQRVGAPPVRFFFPSRGWDFLCHLRSFGEKTGDINLSNENFAPSWALTLFITEDNSPIKSVQDSAILQYIQRLSQGLGWEQTKYNGPLTEADVASYVSSTGATSIMDLLGRLG